VVLLQLFQDFNAFALYQRNANVAASTRELAVHIAD